MDFTRYNQAQSQARSTSANIDAGLREYMLGVYNYMAGALVVTGLIAYLVSSSEVLVNAIFGSPLQWVVMLAPFAFILVLSFGVQRMKASTAQLIFWLYAAAMGASLASIFLAYTGQSIANTFFIAAATFGALSAYGYATKKDLSGVGKFLMMGLIGIIIASLINIFLKSSGLEFAVSVIGVLVFSGLTAYNTQQIKHIYYQVGGHGELAKKASIMGALQLYLDFINLFLIMLRFVGERR